MESFNFNKSLFSSFQIHICVRLSSEELTVFINGLEKEFSSEMESNAKPEQIFGSGTLFLGRVKSSTFPTSG